MIQKHLALLGLPVVDKVTGVKGIVTSMSFDLYGCIQALVNPGIGKDGIQKDKRWFDVVRLKVTSKKPVMEVPNFITVSSAERVISGKKGPANKPVQV